MSSALDFLLLYKTDKFGANQRPLVSREIGCRISIYLSQKGRQSKLQDAKNVQRFGFCIFACAALVSTFLLSACGRTHDYHVRLTVHIDNDGKAVAASGVFDFECTETNTSLGEWGLGGCSVKGEAIPIDLGQNETAFLIMTGPSDYNWDGMVREVFSARPDQSANGWDLNPEKLPRFVTFKSLADSSSVLPVDPEHLSDSFGNRIQLKSVHAEITDDPITKGVIVKYLPWINGSDNATYLTGRTASDAPTLAASLQYYHFKVY